MLKYGAVAEAARFASVHRVYASRIANGKQDWRKARPALIRALYAAGWSPDEPNGRRTVRIFLNKLALSLTVKPLDR